MTENGASLRDATPRKRRRNYVFFPSASLFRVDHRIGHRLLPFGEIAAREIGPAMMMRNLSLSSENAPARELAGLRGFLARFFHADDFDCA